MKKSVKIPLICISIIIIIAIIIISVFAVFIHIGKNQFHKNDTNIISENILEEDGAIVYKANKYRLNKNIISFLLIGIDKKGVNNDYTIGANGQADTILVCTLDTVSGAATIIPISRETLVDVNRYTTSGDFAGVINEQICLAYAYGKDVKQCSENVLLSVSRVLYGINIGSYITMDLDALEKISNAVGSVQVIVNEDYTDNGTGNKYKPGDKIYVKGKSAVKYIHWRSDNILANNYRMARQLNFIKAFINKAGNTISKDSSKILTFYNILKPYVYTDISITQATYLATTFLKGNMGDSIQYKIINGDIDLKDGYSAFTPDEETLTEIIIDTFYQKIS